MGDETKVQMVDVKKGAAAMGNVVERYMIRALGPIGNKIALANKTGRVVALIGVTAIILSLVLGFTMGLIDYGTTHAKRGLKLLWVRYEMQDFILLVVGYIMYKIGTGMKK